MRRLNSLSQPFLTLFLFSFFLLVASQNCNTDQNPSCSGNSALESICCTWPNICYWSNRDGTPACCPQGQDCRLNGGPAPNEVTYTPVQVTQVQQSTYYVTQVYTTTQPQYSTVVVLPTSTTSNVPVQATQATTFSTVTTNAVIVLTATQGVTSVQPTVQVTTVNGQFISVTQAAGAVGTHQGQDLLRAAGAVAMAAGLVMAV